MQAPVNAPLGVFRSVVAPQEEVKATNPTMAGIIAFIHGCIPAVVAGLAFVGPSRYAWVSTLIVLLCFTNWELDPKKLCFLSRLENSYRGEENDEDNNFLWRHLGPRFPQLTKQQFYSLMSVALLTSALVGLLRFADFCNDLAPSAAPSSGKKKGILKRGKQ